MTKPQYSIPTPGRGVVFAKALQLRYNANEMRLGAGMLGAEVRNQSRHCNVYSSEQS